MAKDNKRSRLAMGSTEYGDVYTELRDADGKPVLQNGKFVRHQMVGRLVIDFGSDEFWLRPIRGVAQRLTMTEVSSLVANDLVQFDNPNSRQQLIQYLMEYDKKSRTLQEAQVKAIESKAKASAIEKDTKLQRSVRRNSRIAKFTWTLAMLGIVLIALYLTLPQAEPAPASSTISGIGQELPVDSSSIQASSYIQALGNGTDLYGIVTNASTKEVGDTTSDNSTVNENQIFNPSASSQPIHMRPLYYDKSAFYQSELTVDTYGNSKTAIYTQNPNGYALGVSANQLMLVTGSGFDTLPLLTPDTFEEKDASETQGDIEDQQNDTASERTRRSTSSNDESQTGAGMPDGWLGVETASINSERIAVSYWYTKGNTGLASDRHRRIAILNIKGVLANGRKSVSDMDIAQINYQDADSNFYAPQISLDDDSKGVNYLLAYTKQDYNGNTGFFVRRIQSDQDVLVESYTNTFSGRDITGSSDPISNYHFVGNRLFFEQSGYIWMVNLAESKLSVTVNGNQRTVSRENPIRICRSSDIFSSITSDEQREADETGNPVSPVAHYTPMTITTSDGKEYGLVFVEADTGDLVFQPAVDMSATSSMQGNGTGADSTANGVGSGDEAAIQELLNKDVRDDDYDRNMEGQMVDVPDVMGWNATDAISALQDRKFTVKTTGGTGIVIGVSPNGQAVYGSTITLTLGESQTTGNAAIIGQSSSSERTSIRQVAYSLNGNDADDADDDENASSNANDGGNSNVSTNSTNTNAIEADATSSVQLDIGNGRIAIRNVQTDHATVVCFAVRGEQIIWIEKDADTDTRHVKFSPVYYKDSRSTVEAYDEADNVQSAVSSDTQDTNDDRSIIVTGGSDTISGTPDTDVQEQNPDGDGTQQDTEPQNAEPQEMEQTQEGNEEQGQTDEVSQPQDTEVTDGQ